MKAAPFEERKAEFEAAFGKIDLTHATYKCWAETFDCGCPLYLTAVQAGMEPKRSGDTDNDVGEHVIRFLTTRFGMLESHLRTFTGAYDALRADCHESIEFSVKEALTGMLAEWNEHEAFLAKEYAAVEAVKPS